MSLTITPSVEQWLTQTDAFTIIFRAKDNLGNTCTGNQLFIEYSITYDGSMPDITQMHRYYGDASGLIALTITKPCVITIFAGHLKDINNPSLGEVTQELAVNYEITFQPIILQMNAVYTGPDIPITDSFNPNDLVITAIKSDGTTINIDVNDCQILDYEVQLIGSNIKTLSYYDVLLKSSWDIEFEIIGIPKLLYIVGEYIGDIKFLGDRVYPEEFNVHGVFLTDITTESIIDLTPEQWFFSDLPLVTQGNNGIIKIGYQDKIIQVTVPFRISNSLWLNVWYEGVKIKVGNTYKLDDVVIYIVTPDHDPKRITYKECEIDSNLVSEEGWNWFNVIYTQNGKQYKQTFPVLGYIEPVYKDHNFKVLYQEPDGTLTDFTAACAADMTFEDVLMFSWDSLLQSINKSIMKYGVYIVTVPKRTGLSKRHDSEWEVRCINKTTIKAHIKTIYDNKEE